MGWEYTPSRCLLSLIMVMQASHLGYDDYPSMRRRGDWPRFWTIHCQEQMGAKAVVILEVTA